jgi:hypothetical protein
LAWGQASAGVTWPPMAKIDPEQERQRLSEFYSRQMDGELEKTAGQAYELTEVARELLRAELARRGLTPKFVENAPIILKKKPMPMPGDPPPPEPPVESMPGGEPEQRDLVTIRRFRDLPEALLAEGSLKSSGIDCLLIDDNTIRMDWFWSNLLGGIKLQVDSENAEAASEILDQPIPESLEVAGIGEYEQPRCPKCSSLDVAFRELDPAAYLTLVVNLPIPIHRKAWRCHSCGMEWEEVPEQPELPL